MLVIKNSPQTTFLTNLNGTSLYAYRCCMLRLLLGIIQYIRVQRGSEREGVWRAGFLVLCI